MNPLRKIADRLMNWWKGETAPEVSDSTELTGGVMTLNSPSFLESMGLSRKRKTTSEVTYFTCLKMLSETLAKMPIKYYQRTDKGIIEAEQTDTSKLLTKRPNPFMTPTVFWNTVEINRNHYGNAYVYMRKKFIRKKYGGEVKILDLWVMQSNCVQIVVDDAGIFAGKGRLWYVYTDPTSGSQYVFDTSEVMHFKTSFSFDGVTGLPVQQILRDTISGASASQRYMNSLYESGLTAKATLEYTGELNDKAKEALVKSFEDFGSGARNTGKIIPVPLGMKLTPLDIKLSDSQFFELKKYTALQIAAAFGVKPNQINDYSKSSYANSELQQLSFYVDTELFVIKQYEEEINYKMLTDEEQDDGFYYKYNEKVLFRTDSKTQMEYLKNGVSGSIMKPNEARRKLDLPDGEGGDTLLANGSIVPLTMAGAAYQKGQIEQEETEKPEQPEEETEPDTEQPDTTGQPDETDEAEDEEQSRCSLYFYGDIVSATWESMWFEEDRCPQDIADFLNQLDGYEDIDIYFNSGGGDVFAGLAIYNQLKRYSGHKVGYVDGMAASIASVIMFACDELHFATGAQAMIHKPLCMAWGNADDFKEVIKQLDLCEDSILDVYEEHLKEGVTRDKIKSFMAKEKWFSGAELAEYFDILIDEKAAVAACASDYFEKYNHVPESIKGTATKDIVDAVLAELENRNNAAAEAEKQRIEAEKQDILADLDMYGI